MKYVGSRYVPKFMGTYDATQIYEALCVVDNALGTSYISQKIVPAGTPLTDNTYWAIYGASSGAVIDLQNQIDIIKKAVTTPEMFGAAGDGVSDDTQAVQDAFDNGDHIILSNEYKITSTLFLSGNKTVSGTGKLLGYLPASDVNEYLIIMGASDIGSAADTFSGVIENITIELHSGNYNYVIACINADNTEFNNIYFDLSSADCHNKVIFIGFDNDVVSDNSSDKNYSISNCTFIFDSDMGSSYNLCECIGVLRRSLVLIKNNNIRYAKDDLGVHHCHYVDIIGNKMLDNFYGRIYVGNSTDFKINGNEIVENIYRWTMGILVEWETTAVSADIIPSVFEIIDNIVDYRNNTTATTTYGIRVRGAKKGIISGNRMLFDSNQYGRIVVENEEPSGSLLSRLYVEDIEICNNICSSFLHGIANASISDSIIPLYIHDNICEYSLTSSNIANVTRDNIIVNPSSGSDLDISLDSNYVPYNNDFVFSGTGTLSEQPMLIGGSFEKRVAKKSKITNYFRVALAEEIALTGSDYYRFYIKKNGTTIREVLAQGSRIDVTNISDNIFSPGDILTVTFKYTGNVPSPQPSSILFELLLLEFENC